MHTIPAAFVTNPAPIGAVPLHALPVGARATVVHLRMPHDDDDRELLLRLIEIGFLPGETVRVVARARAGREPIAVRLGGQATFALRQREADLVQVQPMDTQEPPT
ncbi:MAG: ferrous iron transport protein A [Burkholderiaceae bacterium]|jgi:ferrous iron transport protein A|nr:ferrous iron transport protein A [Burkholderiaceae bacterium]